MLFALRFHRELAKILINRIMLTRNNKMPNIQNISWF